MSAVAVSSGPRPYIAPFKFKWWKHVCPVFQDDGSCPFNVCLVPDVTVASMFAWGSVDDRVCMYTEDLFRSFSPVLRARVKCHPLYPIVIKNHRIQSKKCAQAALRRFEILVEWAEVILSLYDESTAHAIIEAHRIHGIKRAQQRYVTLKGQIAEEPVTPAHPSNLEDVLRSPTWTIAEVLALGARRTTRVYDISGNSVWICPRGSITLAYDFSPHIQDLASATNALYAPSGSVTTDTSASLMSDSSASASTEELEG